MPKKTPSDVSIGKFDILATYVYAQALLHGLDDDEAKQRGMGANLVCLRKNWSSRNGSRRAEQALEGSMKGTSEIERHE